MCETRIAFAAAVATVAKYRETEKENVRRLNSALAAVGIAKVLVTYEGSKGLGWVHFPVPSDANGVWQYPDGVVEYLDFVDGHDSDGAATGSVAARHVMVEIALEAFTLDMVNHRWNGWGNAAGGRGTLTFEVSALGGAVTLAHTQSRTRTTEIAL